MAKQKRKKAFGRINSFFLTIIFVFSSVFVLTGCSTPKFFVGVIFRNYGSQFISDNVSGPILETLFNEYGMANEHAVDGTTHNNWGNINFSHLLGKTGASLTTGQTITVANEVSQFTHFYHKAVTAEKFILMFVSRELSPTELGDGSNGTNAGMIVGYENDSFFLRYRKENINNGNYGNQNVSITDFSASTLNPTKFSDLVPPLSPQSNVSINTNTAYKYDYQRGGGGFDSFCAYIFVGSAINGNAIGSAQPFINNFYFNNHSNSIQSSLLSFSSSALLNNSWERIESYALSWEASLSEREMDSYSTYNERLPFYVDKYRDYLSLLIAKTFVELNNKWSNEVQTKYDEAFEIVSAWMENGDIFPDEVLQGMTDLNKFITYVTVDLNINLNLASIETKHITTLICKNIISPFLFSYSSSGVATEIISGPLNKNYISTIETALTNALLNNTGQSISTPQSAPSSRGYFLDDTRKGFNSNLTCSLNALFFCNRTERNIFNSFSTKIPSFTVLFEADPQNLANLKNYELLLYYHKGDSTKNINEKDSLNKTVTLEIDKNDLDDGMINVDVFAAFAAEYPEENGKDNISFRAANSVQNFPENLNDIGWVGTNQIYLGKDTSGKDVFSHPVGFFDYVGGQDNFDFVELIFLPRNGTEIAFITIIDIWV